MAWPATETTDVVVAIGKGDLKVLQQWDLQGGRVTWGPERVGDAVFLAVNGDSIRCFDAGNKPRWEQPSPAYAQPAGRPLQNGSDFIFAGVDGSVWRVAGHDGSALTQDRGGGAVEFRPDRLRRPTPGLRHRRNTAGPSPSHRIMSKSRLLCTTRMNPRTADGHSERRPRNPLRPFGKGKHALMSAPCVYV